MATFFSHECLISNQEFSKQPTKKKPCILLVISDTFVFHIVIHYKNQEMHIARVFP